MLGVLFVTGEYGTGMIRSSLTTVPARLRILYAKALVFAAVTLVSTEIVAFIGFSSANSPWPATPFRCRPTEPYGP